MQTHQATHTHTHTHSASHTPHCSHTHTHKALTITQCKSNTTHTHTHAHTHTHIQSPPHTTITTVCKLQNMLICMGSTENKHQRKLQRVKTIRLLRCQCLQPSTSVPLVTSRRTADSPVLMMSLIHNDRFWQLNPRISPPCSHCLQLRVPRSFSTSSTLPFSAIKILHVSGSLRAG